MMTRNMNNIYLFFLYEMRAVYDISLTDDYLESFHNDFKKLYKTYFDILMKCESEIIDTDCLIIDTSVNKKKLKKIRRRILLSTIPEFAHYGEKLIEYLLNKEIITFLYDDKKYE